MNKVLSLETVKVVTLKIREQNSFLEFKYFYGKWIFKYFYGKWIFKYVNGKHEQL